MKIQRGIVKYKDRNDIVCTYALTDDGKQYYFLDENDEKKFANGNRVVTTSLVEAVDPMVKTANVGVIDGNGVVVIPFENRSIKPVNGNVIIVEKANPTGASVLQAMEMRNDPNQASMLVSTPATIKDRINAQMGVEGNYLFNDQFSEATLCDINGANLIGGETYSFISLANDKLYMSKNTADSPIAEFSLTTYEFNPGLAAQAAPVEAAPASQDAAQPIDVSTTVVDQQVVEGALNAQATTEAVAPVEGVPADAMAAEVPAAEEAQEEGKQLIFAYNDSVSTITDMPFGEAPTEEVAAAPVEGVPAETPVDAVAETAPVEGVPADAMAAEAPAAGDTVDFPVAEDETVATDFATAEAPATGEFSAEDTSISDDLKAFANGFASDEEVAEEAPVAEEATEEVPEATEEVAEETEEAPAAEETTEEVNDTVEETTEEAPADVEEEAEDDTPPVVEEDDKEDEVVAEEAPTETVEETTEEVHDTVEETPEDTHEETFSDIVNTPVDKEEEETPAPVTIDAETVLATVDRNMNGIIDSDEIMVPQAKTPVHEPVTTHDSLLDVYNQKEDNFGYRPVENYSPSTFDYDPLLATKKSTPSYGYSDGKDNIMADVARSMSELMRQNKEQRAVITEYRDKVETLQSQARILNEKYKDQAARYETLSDKLRSLDEAAGRIESKNQLLESRVRDQEKIIASQERELKVLRPQVEGKQDLVRLLADARTLLGSETSYGGYESEGSDYYRRAA